MGEGIKEQSESDLTPDLHGTGRLPVGIHGGLGAKGEV
ncbi:MAG: hypothetical protein RL333_1069, partial [Pseudomonadota bacterium]